MNEDQREPAKKWYKKQSKIPALLALLLFLCVCIAMTCIIIINMDGGSCCVPRSAAYSTAREQIQNAVTNYSGTYNKSLPILSGIYTNANCSSCHVINISTLVVANGGLLRRSPDGLNLSASGNDNCGGNASLGCHSGWSYIWIVDIHGTVYSYCAGAGCTTNNSGYQGVWP
jgi:hypothetical protein